MEAYTKALRALSDTLSWFVRARELRLLYIETTPALRSAVIQLCRSKELHPDNPSPFVLLEDAHTREGNGWNEGVLRLRAQYAQRASAMQKIGEHLPPLPPAPSTNDGLKALALQLEQFLFARAPWHDGMVALMAPSRVELPQAYAQQLGSLLSMNELLPLRFIVIDPQPPALSGVLAHGGESVLRTSCAEDEKEARAELGAMMEAMAEAHPALSGPARIGAAWPSKGVLPPSRADWPHADPGSIDAQLLEEGVAEPLAGTVGRKLSQAVLMGARAMREQRLKEAVEYQELALRLCVEAKEERGAVIMELVLGAYWAAANEINKAYLSYESAGRRALGADLFELSAQADMARAALVLSADRKAESEAGAPGKEQI